jgi:hypothetical protein
MSDVPAELLAELAKTLPGHGSVVFKVFDTRSKKATLAKAKLQSKELTVVLDTSNEEDIASQFKVKRGTKEYANVVMERLSVVFKEGQLNLDFDWNGIRRIQIEAALRAEKLAERKKKDEEDRIAREKHKEEERIAEQMRQLALKQEEERRIQAAKEAEEARKRREQEEREREAKDKRRAFEDKIGNALLNGGVLTHIPKEKDDAERHPAEDENLAGSSTNVTKTWSDEHRAYYYTDTDTNEISWRDPRIISVWEKSWDSTGNSFKFVNKQTGETLWEEPYCARIEKIYVAEEKRWYYVNRETGDTQISEPYY